MWHAARKQEKMIRVMMVDYQKRAGRRREYYECIKQDPNQFLRVYGRSMKVHIDPALAAVADGPQIMQPWQGDSEVQIDRYDVRSHIDYIAPPIQNAKDNTDLEENRCNYERYRILVQNDCAGVSEDQCLQQIYHDELFGSSDSNKSEEDKKRKLAEKKAAIGFIYDDGSSGIRVPDFKKEMEEEVSDEEIDLDNILDIDMLTEEQEQVLNGLSVEYGMEGNDYSEFLQLDRDEMEALRAVKQIEEEKAQFSGRKSRRERRAFKERRLRNRKLSPPSYATKINTASVPTYEQLRGSSSSRSRSPPGTGVIQFITSFGNNGGRRSSDDEKQLQGPSLPAPRDPNKPIVGPKLPDRGRRSSKSPRRRSRSPRRRSRSQRRRSRSPRRRSRKRSRSNRRSRSRDRNRGRRSRSRSEGRSNGYRRDYSRRLRRSRSLSRSRSRLSSRSPSSSSSCSKPSRSCSRSRSRGSKGTSTQTPIKKYRRSSLSSKSESDDDDGKKDSSRIKKDSSGSKSEQNRSVPGKGSVASSKVNFDHDSAGKIEEEDADGTHETI